MKDMWPRRPIATALKVTDSDGNTVYISTAHIAAIEGVETTPPQDGTNQKQLTKVHIASGASLLISGNVDDLFKVWSGDV